jgi:hypothetical protein
MLNFKDDSDFILGFSFLMQEGIFGAYYAIEASKYAVAVLPHFESILLLYNIQIFL